MAQPELDEPLIDFFKSANINAIHRVIERAQKAAERAHRKQLAGAKVSSRPGLLAKAMNKAMASYGRATKNRASIRQTAPDTGGRPYHFGYSTVTKGTSTRGRKGHAASSDADAATAARGGGTTGTAGQGGKTAAVKSKRTSKAGGSRRTAKTVEAAHQIYTERDGAVEQDAPAIDPDIGLGPEPSLGTGRDAGPGPAGPSGLGAGVGEPATAREHLPAILHEQERDDDPELTPGRTRKKRPTELEAERARDFVEDAMAAAQGITGRASAAAAQAYIEDPSKTPSLMGTTASFGTIGKTLEERMAFWDAVHDHESDKGGRTQTRVVLELPHEATHQDRHEIVRRYTDEFRRKGIPFWASIHAPTKANDARNHHAHVVFTDRPMQQMPHPETGEMVWDFTIAETYRNATRHTRTRYPYRQNRDPEMRDRGYVKVSRARFAAIVNEVMEKSANPVRYDPRSYKDMGLDVAPMRNVTRILADKLDKRRFVVMDAEWTRKMIDAEIQAAAARRDKTFVALQASEQHLQDITKGAAKARQANARLPKHLRLPPTHMLGKAAAAAFTTKIVEVERDRLATQFVNEATLTALQHIVTATTPHKTGKGRGRAFDPASAPDPEDLAALHAAALEEITALNKTARTQQVRSQSRHQTLRDRWNGWRAPAEPWAGPTPAQPLPPTARPAPATGAPGIWRARANPAMSQPGLAPFRTPADGLRQPPSYVPDLTATKPLSLDELVRPPAPPRRAKPSAALAVPLSASMLLPNNPILARINAIVQMRLNPMLEIFRAAANPEQEAKPEQSATPGRTAPRTPNYPAPIMGPVHRTTSITNPIPTMGQNTPLTAEAPQTKHQFRPTTSMASPSGAPTRSSSPPSVARPLPAVSTPPAGAPQPDVDPPIAFIRQIPNTTPPQPPRTATTRARKRPPSPVSAITRVPTTVPVTAPRETSRPANSAPPPARQPPLGLNGQGRQQDSLGLDPAGTLSRPKSANTRAPASSQSPRLGAPAAATSPIHPNTLTAADRAKAAKQEKARKRRRALLAKKGRGFEI